MSTGITKNVGIIELIGGGQEFNIDDTYFQTEKSLIPIFDNSPWCIRCKLYFNSLTVYYAPTDINNPNGPICPECFEELADEEHEIRYCLSEGSESLMV